MVLEVFEQQLRQAGGVEGIRAGLIGEKVTITTPFGQQPLVYADYVASGRALRLVEDFVAEQVLPFYANSHTQGSFCGAYTTQLREEARAVIARECNATDGCSVIFSGSGATAGVNRLTSICGLTTLAPEARATVFIGPYEHHSNILPWRESGAEVVEIDESDDTGVDLDMLARELEKRQGQDLLIGAFSAASNVTGLLTDVDAVTRVLKAHGALAFWDYAGGGPYIDIDMSPSADCQKDAVFLSPHKFPGGPGASGLLIVRNDIVRNTKPTWPGGGSVAYVSPWGHDYLDNICEREEAGTPNIIGDIRAALVFLVKAAIGQDFITRRNRDLVDRALAVWTKNPAIKVLAGDQQNRLPIFSFVIQDKAGKYFHHQLITRMLNDRTGIQARGGCACAGPYGHRLLGVGREKSEHIRCEISHGHEIEKPGWVRLNLSYLSDDDKVDYIISQFDAFASDMERYQDQYAVDDASALFEYDFSAATA